MTSTASSASPSHAAGFTARHLQLIRSRTRQGLSISIEPYHSPLVLYDQNDGSPDPSQTTPLGLTLTLRGDASEKRIGGITLMRQVAVRRKIPKTKEWTEWVGVQKEEVEVVGECSIRSSQIFDVYIHLPARLVETRQTHYDQVIHLLTAIVHDLAPVYRGIKTSKKGRRNGDPSKQDGDETAVMGRRRNKDILAQLQQPFDVVHCPSLRGDIPMLECEQIVRLSDSGKVNIKAFSQLFVLGSHVDISLDFHSLTPDTTIHAVSVILVQETSTPLQTSLPDLNHNTFDAVETVSPGPSRPGSPAPDDNQDNRRGRRSRPRVRSRLSSMWNALKDKPAIPQSSVIDEWALLSEGIEGAMSPADAIGVGSAKTSFLWRGEAGRVLDRESHLAGVRWPLHGRTNSGVANNPDLPTVDEDMEFDPEDYMADAKASHASPADGHDLTERTTSRLRLYRRARLPSQVNGANHSTSTLTPILAKVTHRIVVDVIYSILGQDPLGKRLVRAESSLEGTMRQVTTKFEVELAPCSLIPITVQPPSYVDGPRNPSPSRHSPPTQIHSPPGLQRRFSTQSEIMSVRSSEGGLNVPRLPSADIAHSRAFRASNGLVIAPKRVFYSDHDIRIAAREHLKDNALCACVM